jgi:hypothetical protein
MKSVITLNHNFQLYKDDDLKNYFRTFSKNSNLHHKRYQNFQTCNEWWSTTNKCDEVLNFYIALTRGDYEKTSKNLKVSSIRKLSIYSQFNDADNIKIK